MGEPRPLPHRDVFEKHGETGTRFRFGGQSDEVGRAASAWLAEKQAEREEAAAVKRDAREEETLRIANEALASANEANRIASSASAAAARQAKAAERQARWAIIAAAIAIAAAIVDANSMIRELMLYLQQ